MSANVSITYKCCGATYATAVGLFPNAVDCVHALDKLHAAEHPECPPLDAPLPAELHQQQALSGGVE